MDGGRILDLGCATGELSLALSRAGYRMAGAVREAGFVNVQARVANGVIEVSAGAP